MPAPPPFKPPRWMQGIFVLTVGLFFAAAGVWLLSIAYGVFLKERDLLTHAEHVTGTVVDFVKTVYRSHGNQPTRTYYAPVFTFTDRTGAVRRAVSKVIRADKPAYQVGESVPVIYHRDRPGEAELDTFFASWGGLAISGGLGAIFFCVGSLVASAGVRDALRPAGQNLPGAPTTPAAP